MVLFTVLISLLGLLSLRYAKVFQLEGKLNFMPFAYLVKLTVGFIFIYVYSVYYGSEQLTADAGRFMQESRILTNVFHQSPFDYFKFLFSLESDEMVHHYLSATSHWAGDPTAILNDSKNLVKYHSVINFISQGYAPLNMVITAFISLFGIFHLFKVFKNYVAISEKWLLIALLFAPSTLFWTSGILKEPFLFLGIGLFCRGLFAGDTTWKRMLYLFSGGYLLLSLKIYTFVFICIAWIVYLLIIRLKNRMIAVSIVGFVGFSLLLALYFSPTNKFVNVLSDKQYDFIGISKGGNYFRNDSTFFIFQDEQLNRFRVEGENYFLTKATLVEMAYPYQKAEPKIVKALPNKKPWNLAFRFNRCGSYIPVDYINYSPKKLVENVPSALINATVRPYLNDPGSELKYLAFAEVIGLFGFLFFAIWKRRKLSQQEFGVLVALIVFAVLMLLLIGWTTPVLGAIVRYRFSAYLALTLVGVILLKPLSKNNIA